MKVALLIAGQPRCSWYALPSINKHVALPNNADVYVVIDNNPSAVLSVTEEFLLKDTFGDKLKELRYTEDYPDYLEERKYYIHLAEDKGSKINRKRYPAKRFWLYEKGTYSKAYAVCDCWLMIKKCSELIKESYDVIIKMRIDIPWYNPLPVNNTTNLKINFYEELGKTPWTKEYLFYGDQETVQFICSKFVSELCEDLTSWRRDEEELCLVEEIQFGRFLTRYRIPLEFMKEHKAGHQYRFHNLERNQYYQYTKDIQAPLTAYCDAGTISEELLTDDIYNLY